MLSMAWSMIRNHKAGFAGVFIAVLFGSAVMTACGILVDSGLRGGFQPERYAAASVVVGAPQSLLVPGNNSQPYTERAPLPAGRVSEIARIPGVGAAVGDVSVAVSLLIPARGILSATGNQPILVHGWSSAVLAPFTISAGRPPEGPGEAVLDTALAARAGVQPGDTIELLAGSVPFRYRVVGTASPPPGGLQRQSAVFLTGAQALLASGRPDQVGTVGVMAAPGVNAGQLADRITHAVPGVVTYTGPDRADAEFLDIGQARSFLLQAASSLGGVMAIVVMFVVASTLGLSVQQRRREVALLRAIAATPRQVHQMIGAETLILSSAAAVLGAAPGVGVSFLLRDAFASAGVIPTGFTFVVDPLPPVAAVLVCVSAARLAALIAARRAARISPVAALGEAAVEPRRLGRFRQATGYVLIALGLVAAIAGPLITPGQVAEASAAGSALLLIIAVALLGPRLLTAITTLARPLLWRPGGAAGFLASASTRANSRRLSFAATPLIMAVTLTAVQVFTTTTMIAAARQQARASLTADYVLTGTPSGLSPQIAATVSGVPGVSAVTPVARTQVMATYDFGGHRAVQPYAAQGLTPALAATMNLDVRSGSMGALHGRTVALSRTAAAAIGAGLGQTVHLHLGDGTAITPRVVAIYGHGLGFGDVTLPNDVVIEHTSNRVDTAILLRAAPGARAAAVAGALRAVVRSYPGVTVSGRAAFTAAQASALARQPAVTLILDAVLLAYILIAVVNSLVISTAARAREFALLRLIGATRLQIRAMMRGEITIMVATAIIIGTLAALPPLIGTSTGMTGSPAPVIPPLVYLGIVAVVAVLGWGSIMIPARLAMRSRPADLLSSRE